MKGENIMNERNTAEVQMDYLPNIAPVERAFWQSFKKVRNGGIRMEVMNSSLSINKIFIVLTDYDLVGGGFKKKNQVGLYLSLDHMRDLLRCFVGAKPWPEKDGTLLWKSDPMGTSADNLRLMSERRRDPSLLRGGNAEYRVATVRRGEKVPYLFTGTACDGFQNSYKLFQAIVKDGRLQNATKICFPLTEGEVQSLSSFVNWEIQAYANARYTYGIAKRLIMPIYEKLGIEVSLPGRGTSTSPEDAEAAALNEAAVTASRTEEAAFIPDDEDFSGPFDISTADLPF